MRTAEFDYHLPPELIAQTPAEPRDSARLMVIDRDSGVIEHRGFRDLVDYLRPGDRLVANDSRVLPGRLFGRKEPSGGKVELLLLRPIDDRQSLDTAHVWECLIGGRVRPGTRLVFEGPDRVVATGAAPDRDLPPALDAAPDRDLPPALDAAPARLSADPLLPDRLSAEVVAALPDGRRHVRFELPPLAVIDRIGHVPLPPYIRRPPDDPERYQTVYAAASGSAAAPTAGLHFTPALMRALAARGVAWSTVTLHVGLGTFKPVEAEVIHDHRIHREWAVIDAPTARAIAATRRAGGRVIAVGTTSVRVIETAARAAMAAAGSEIAPAESTPPAIVPFAGWTDLYITPGFVFRVTDAIITNFHLPRSSLLMLVAAFAGKGVIDRAYAEAIRERYRFYSFGDAMLIASSRTAVRRAT